MRDWRSGSAKRGPAVWPIRVSAVETARFVPDRCRPPACYPAPCPRQRPPDMSDTAALLPAIETETAPNPRWAVIWLHGLGADGHDFDPIVPQLLERGWPAIRFVFPHAPV